MRVGSFAGLSFHVSDDAVQTIENLSLSASARYSTHQRVNNKDLPEKTGTELMEASFDMTLSAYLGVNPMTVYNRLVKYVNSGKVGSLILGRRRIGKKWTAKSAKLKATFFDGHGAVTSASVSVTLQEYPLS